jgi:hypothetical protein
MAEDRGLYLEFESDPAFDLMLKSLDRTLDGIELVAVRERGDIMLATVFVAEGKLQKLERLIGAYRNEDDARYGQPKNRKLVESISEIRMAVLESFWTDDDALLPASGLAIWWEVWLRVGNDRDQIDSVFVENARAAEIQVQGSRIKFADRTVLLALATSEQMRQSVELLDCVAELRLAKERPEFFMGLEAREQADWVNDLLARIERAEGDLPAVCVLDTGVNNGHPLLSDSLAEDNQGSIHSDRWVGTAADLAMRGHLAVYPVGGWWKERVNLERWRRAVRYTLMVTIRTPEVDVDIYTPVANQVAVAVTP